MAPEQPATCRESRVLRYFRNITPGEQDALERILAKLNGERVTQLPSPSNVISLPRK